jgi:hypothetical protein
MTRVWRDGLDWKAECEEHNDVTWCSDWEVALEAAYGHVAMWHPRVCTHEFGFIINDRHRCLDCGIDLPMPRNLDTHQDSGEGDDHAVV